MKNHLPAWPYYSEDEISAVQKVLKSGAVNYWTGEISKTFEKNFSSFDSIHYRSWEYCGDSLAFRPCSKKNFH